MEQKSKDGERMMMRDWTRWESGRDERVDMMREGLGSCNHPGR